MEQPLKGVRVLDLSRVLAGPFCTMLLADLRADVIKVEPPQGDDTRQWGPPFDANGTSAYFAAVNRNKRSMTLDLKNPQSQAILARMLRQSDVLVENFLPQTAEQFALTPAHLKKLNAQLVHCSITGFGHESQWAQVPGYDFMMQAMAGWMAISGPQSGEPSKIGVALVDIISGLFAAVGICAQLRQAKPTDSGSPYTHIDIALWQSALASLANVMQAFLVSKQPPQRYGNAHPTIVPYQTFPTKDGFIAIAVGNDRQYQDLCRRVQRRDLGENPLYQTNPQRVQNRAPLVAELEKTFMQQTTSAWLQWLKGSAVPHGPVQSIPDALKLATELDPQCLTHDECGGRYIRNPILPEQTQVKAPPQLGQHTAEILKEFGGT